MSFLIEFPLMLNMVTHWSLIFVLLEWINKSGHGPAQCSAFCHGLDAMSQKQEPDCITRRIN